MDLRESGMFAVKLRELERQYGRLRTRLERCQSADHETVRRLLGDVLAEVRESTGALEKSAEGARSPAEAELAAAQRDYARRMERILREELPRLMGGEDIRQERAEAAALFAEYAIDFAGQASQGALAAALSAMDQQMSWEEQTGKEAQL